MLLDDEHLPLSTTERRLLAYLTLHHRGKVPAAGADEVLAPGDDTERMLDILALLRAADALDSRVLQSPRLVFALVGLFSGAPALNLCGVVLIPFTAIPLLMWFWMVRKKFVAGNIVPAVVVNLDPPTVAVLTDLRQTDDYGPWTVIKTLEQPLGRMTGGPPQMGQRLAAIATYQDNGDTGRWSSFIPTSSTASSSARKKSSAVSARSTRTISASCSKR